MEEPEAEELELELGLLGTIELEPEGELELLGALEGPEEEETLLELLGADTLELELLGADTLELELLGAEESST